MRDDRGHHHQRQARHDHHRPASQAAGTYYPLNVAYAGFLKVSTTSTNDVTVTHGATIPQYATA